MKKMNKILLGIGFFTVLIGIYFYTRPSVAEPMKNQNKSFIPSDKFAGAKEGYVFKMDSKGLGYYLDKKKK
jgi:hypothetical protein